MKRQQKQVGTKIIIYYTHFHAYENNSKTLRYREFLCRVKCVTTLIFLCNIFVLSITTSTELTFLIKRNNIKSIFVKILTYLYYP